MRSGNAQQAGLVRSLNPRGKSGNLFHLTNTTASAAIYNILEAAFLKL